MTRLRVLTAAEQVAVHLRGELERGAWRGRMPGADRLATELAVGHSTMEAALHQLETEGVLVPQGRGKRRRIVLPERRARRVLRLGVLLHQDQGERRLDYMLELQHGLEEAGHLPFYADRTQHELAADPRRLGSLVERNEADGWVVCSAPRKLLAWFAEQEFPAMALFGYGQDLPIARVGPDKEVAFRCATRRLIELGHRRIVLLARPQRLDPCPGPPEQAFLDEMAAHGLPTGSYHVPRWEDCKDGFHRIIDELFRVTPPTALIIEEAVLFLAAQEHLARQGVHAPEQVSLVCTDPEGSFDWCEPSVAHMCWDSRPVVRGAVRWANEVARGRVERRQVLTEAGFVEGGTIGPAPIE